MARTYLDIPFTGEQQVVDNIARQILTDGGYREIPYGNEVVWKMGTGMMTAMHYIKLEYTGPNALRLAGWVQIGIGSVGGKERDLTGFVGVIPKKSVQGTMERIRAAIWATEHGGHQPEPQQTAEYDAPPLQSYMPDIDRQDPTEEYPAPTEYMPEIDRQDPTEAYPAPTEYMPEIDRQNPTEAYPAPTEYMPEVDRQNPAEAYPPPQEYTPATDRVSEPQGKQTLFCPSCGTKLRIQAGNKRFHVVCPKCKHDFFYEP